MLFRYNYVPHKLEKLQAWMSQLVKEVWCKPRQRFSLGLLDPEFQKVVRESKENAAKNDFLWEPIHRIHNLCRDKLSSAQRADLAKWFDDNNDIEGLCSGSPNVLPVTYEKIASVDKQLADELKNFFTNLWSEVRKRKPVTDRLGTLGDHFGEFRKANLIGICPFCGIARIEGVFSSTQEDYDHFLPKGKYAFNAVAMKNLAPICDKCNKKYKLQQDPLHGQDGARRKAFYLFSDTDPGITFCVTLIPLIGKPIDAGNLCPENIQLDISAPGREEEIKGWKEVFKIEDRYKDLCCASGTGGNYWLEQVLGEMKYEGKGPADALATIQRVASHSKWADVNFLKIPFLEGCQKAGFIR
jgi:5-methylcytosine-specific restriction endonuclease McrA